MENNVAGVLRQEIKDIVKEALKEVLAENKIYFGGVDLAITPDKAVNMSDKKAEKAKETLKADPTNEAVKAGNDAVRKIELEDMKYNELKALVSSLGGKAVGSKDALIEQVLKLEGEQSDDGENAENDQADAEGNGEADAKSNDGNDEESTTEEAGDSKEDFIAFLKNLPREELEEIADECNTKYTAKMKSDSLIKLLVVDLTILEKALDVLGYYDEDDSEEDAQDDAIEAEEAEGAVDDDKNIADELGLRDMSIEELADILAEHELSTKGKKEALIDRIVKGIEDGTIELSDDEEEEEEEEEAPVKEEPKKAESKKAETKEDKKPLKKAEVSKYPERDTKEAEIEANIRKLYAGKKLKDTEIAKFVKNYVDGNPKSLSKEEALELYIEVKKSLVDDEGAETALEEPYERNGEYHCCGRELKTLDNGNPYCEICGTEYEA